MLGKRVLKQTEEKGTNLKSFFSLSPPFSTFPCHGGIKCYTDHAIVIGLKYTKVSINRVGCLTHRYLYKDKEF